MGLEDSLTPYRARSAPVVSILLGGMLAGCCDVPQPQTISLTTGGDTLLLSKTTPESLGALFEETEEFVKGPDGKESPTKVLKKVSFANIGVTSQQWNRVDPLLVSDIDNGFSSHTFSEDSPPPTSLYKHSHNWKENPRSFVTYSAESGAGKAGIWIPTLPLTIGVKGDFTTFYTQAAYIKEYRSLTDTEVGALARAARCVNGTMKDKTLYLLIAVWRGGIKEVGISVSHYEVQGSGIPGSVVVKGSWEWQKMDVTAYTAGKFNPDIKASDVIGELKNVEKQSEIEGAVARLLSGRLVEPVPIGGQLYKVASAEELCTEKPDSTYKCLKRDPVSQACVKVQAPFPNPPVVVSEHSADKQGNEVKLLHGTGFPITDKYAMAYVTDSLIDPKDGCPSGKSQFNFGVTDDSAGVGWKISYLNGVRNYSIDGTYNVNIREDGSVEFKYKVMPNQQTTCDHNVNGSTDIRKFPVQLTRGKVSICTQDISREECIKQESPAK